MTVLWLSLAGSAGAVLRHLLDTAVRARRPGPFPYGILLVNVSGSLLLGVLTGLVLFHGRPQDLLTVAGTGFCGGYTTFSTTSVDTVRLIRSGDYRLAAVDALGTLGLSLAAAGAGLALTSAL